MNNYELTFLRSQVVEDGNLVVNQIQDIIQDNKGIIAFLTNPQRISLAHSIKKNLVADIITIEFSLMPAKIKEVEKQIKLSKDVLRYILVKKNNHEKKVSKIKKNREESKIKKTITEILINNSQKKEDIKKFTKAAERDKVNLEDIDKKLDEML